MKRVAIKNKARGSWELRWTTIDPLGKRHGRERSVYGTRKQAEEEAFRIEVGINSEQAVFQTNYTLASWLDWWLESKRSKNRSPETLEHYQEQIAYILEYPIARVPIKKITAMAIEEFFDLLRTRESRYGRPLSSRSVAHVWAVVVNALNTAERLDQIVANPMRKLTREKVTPVKGTRALTTEEFAAYVAAADREVLAGALIHFALDSGVRREDLGGLEWSSIDLDTRRVEIKQALVWTKAGGLQFRPPKTEAGKRKFYVSKKAIEALRAWKTDQQHQKRSMGEKYHDCGLIFPRLDGLPGVPGNNYQRVRQFQIRHGLAKVSLHELRHTAITNGIEAGHDPKSVADRAGQSDLRVTMGLYYHPREGEKQRIGEVYDRLSGFGDNPVG